MWSALPWGSGFGPPTMVREQWAERGAALRRCQGHLSRPSGPSRCHRKDRTACPSVLWGVAWPIAPATRAGNSPTGAMSPALSMSDSRPTTPRGTSVVSPSAVGRARNAAASRRRRARRIPRNAARAPAASVCRLRCRAVRAAAHMRRWPAPSCRGPCRRRYRTSPVGPRLRSPRQQSVRAPASKRAGTMKEDPPPRSPARLPELHRPRRFRFQLEKLR